MKQVKFLRKISFNYPFKTIIIKYLVRETLKNQLSIFLILLIFLFFQKLIKILSATVDGEIPINLVLFLLWLGVPEIAQLILPLSLFVGILVTFGKLYAENEIIVMHACGFSKVVLVKAAMILALFTGIIATINVIWVGPISLRHQEKVLARAKCNPSMTVLAHGQFQQFIDGHSVLFIKSVKGNRFNEVFLAQLRPKGHTRPSVVVADSGRLVQSKNDGSYIITLNKGTRFEGTATLRDFYITDFQNYQTIISHQADVFIPSSMEHANMQTLIKTNTNRARSELHWRITLIFIVFMMALMVVPLSVVNSRLDNMISMIPAMILYLIFFLLQTSIKSNGGKGKIDPMVWTWIVNIIYLLLAVGLNIWDIMLIRRFRARFMRKGII